MQLGWIVDARDVEQIREFVASREGDYLVQHRISRNVKGSRDPIDRSVIWRSLVACLLSSQQRSGPRSAVTRFQNESPFPLTLERCRSQSSLASYTTACLTDFGGIRRARTIGRELETNLGQLDDSLWKTVESSIRRLLVPTEPGLEREVAVILRASLCGIGPKQARNLLQSLGLTRYEIPLDSRITKWLNEFGFPVRLSAGALGDEDYYNFVSDGIQELCRASDVYPCVLDAAIFSSFDDGGWEAVGVIW